MRARKLQKLWRKFHLRDTEEEIPPGNLLHSARTDSDGTRRIFDPLNSEFIANPYSTYRYLREHEPIQRGATGAWVLSRYEDIANALVDSRLGNAPSKYATVNKRNADRYLCADLANNILPFLDPPDHTVPRKLISHSFHQYLVKNPPPLTGIAEQVLEGLPRSEEFDLLSKFATPYTAKVFCHLLGTDEKQIPELLQWSDWFFYLLTVIPSAQARIQIDQALANFRACIAQLVEARKSKPGTDFISYLLQENGDQAKLDDIQIIDNLILLFADGVENVDKAICNAVTLFLKFPEQRDLLDNHPEFLPQAVDECLRYESPAQFIGRVAKQDLEISGQLIRRNEAILLLLGSANRDLSQFDNADTFDITRKPNPHLSFGKSRHGCVGGIFVRQEMQAALKTILNQLPGVELSCPDLNWQPRMGHRWLVELRMRYRDI